MHTHACVKFKVSGTVHGRSADTNLAEIHEQMSELLSKQVNVQKESLKKTSWIHASSCKPTKKVCDENERKKVEEKKQWPCQKNFCGRKDFIRPYLKTG